MDNSKKTKEKICAFYASDYHFEMVSLPYINENMKNDNEIVILTENNLEGTMKKLLEKVNLKEDKKEDILNLNWKNDDIEKFQKIKEDIKDDKNLIVFVKGKEKYINKTNDEINNLVENNDNIRVIDCYNMEEIGTKLDKIITQYNKILNTTGEKEIEKF